MWTSEVLIYLQELFGYTTGIVLLPVLSMSLLIAYLNKRDFLEKCGFDRAIIGLIIIGSFFGATADIPFIVLRDAVLNINLGGALIPVIVSIVLIKRKKLNFFALALGLTLVSVSAYMVSEIDPGRGIIAEFPFYLLPAIISLLVGVVFSFFHKKKILENSVAYSYTFGVLGSLIGADLVRIPELVEMGMLGSFGGAGAQDLVYLSGLIAAVPLIYLGYFRREPSLPENPILRAEKYLANKDYEKSLELIKKQLDGQIQRAKNLLKKNTNRLFSSDLENPSIILWHLGFSKDMIYDFNTLVKTKPSQDHMKAQKDILTGKLLSENIEARLNQVYMSLSRRVLAYFIDLIILGIPFVIFFGYIFLTAINGTGSFLLNEALLIAVLSLITSIQFLYFTLSEWYFGTTLGKAALGLKVTDDDIGDITLLQSIARNAGRYADIALAFYLFSLMLMLRSPEQRRIGDYMAKTRVVKIR